MQGVLSLILGGGRGTRLYPLTQLRSKPAVPLGGKYRLIDIPISNCINSGLNRIYVLTQFLSVSLHRHIANTYKFDPFSNPWRSLRAIHHLPHCQPRLRRSFRSRRFLNRCLNTAHPARPMRAARMPTPRYLTVRPRQRPDWPMQRRSPTLTCWLACANCRDHNETALKRRAIFGKR
jgi:hypothetical protein